MHTLLDLRGNIPSFIHISDGKLHDVNVLDLLVPEPGAIYVMDRGYVDFARLSRAASGGRVLRHSRQVESWMPSASIRRQTDRSTGIICDQTIALNGFYSRRTTRRICAAFASRIPKPARRWSSSPTTSTLPALTICALYKSRWQVELFFKWIKQHLRIKRFYGTSRMR